MSNIDNLTSYKKGDPRAVAGGKKGGKRATIVKKHAAKVREIKKRAANNTLKSEDELYLLKMVEDPKVMSLDMLGWANDIKKKLVSSDDEMRLLGIVNQIHKTIHGDKKIVESKNINLNVSMTPDELNDLFEEII